MAALLVWPPLATARLWRAAVTPLASIIGSGFLVLGPILNNAYGYLAPLVMIALCGGAWLFGWAIRANILAIARLGPDRPPLALRLEDLGSWSLAFAYVISVSYYLNLFGAFGVRLTPLSDPIHAKMLTTAVYVLILVVGWLRGFHALERMEQLSVGIKLAIIAGLLAGLVRYLMLRLADGNLVLSPSHTGVWDSVTLAFGLIVTVQGFETSRYLGAEYDAPTRIRSMMVAQVISTAIYVAYIALLALTFAPDAIRLNETAIIEMMAVVAPILSILLIVAALAAQLSAAIADTNGSGGLVAELTRGRIRDKWAYALLVGLGLLLTWTSNVFEIISYASRAFALYYGIQSAIAGITALKTGAGPTRAALYFSLSVLAALIAVFGTPAE